MIIPYPFFCFTGSLQALRDHPPPREKFAQCEAHNRSAVPGLLQLSRELRSHLIQCRDMFILKLDGYFNKPVLMLIVCAVAMFMMAVAAGGIVVVRRIVFRIHSSPQFINTEDASSTAS